YALRRFADLASAGNTPDARRVRALALARYAELVPAPLALRARAEAARAFLGAGDRVAARQVLARVAADSSAPPDAQALAQSGAGGPPRGGRRRGGGSPGRAGGRRGRAGGRRPGGGGGGPRGGGRRGRGGGGGGGGGGRAYILLIAGRVAARMGVEQQQTALALFDDVARSGEKSAAAPAAELEWARLLERQQKTAEAIAHLEHLILAYPESAVVPEARRELERA